METETNRFNMFGIGGVVILIVAVVAVFYTNPELITSWFSGESLKGKIEWTADGTVNVVNNSDVDWKDIRIILNKGIVAQRYEVTAPSNYEIKAGGSFFVKFGQFKKTNGDAYRLDNGEPHTITVEISLPDGKKGALEVKLGGKRLTT